MKVPLLGLKARNVIAWAEASLRAKAQVTGHQNSPALKGHNTSRAPLVRITVPKGQWGHVATFDICLVIRTICQMSVRGTIARPPRLRESLPPFFSSSSSSSICILPLSRSRLSSGRQWGQARTFDISRGTQSKCQMSMSVPDPIGILWIIFYRFGPSSGSVGVRGLFFW